ncbi:NET domain - like 1 [Theobroma cacao]|nr:NET domain - like 1 [Theobroma cacao]
MSEAYRDSFGSVKQFKAGPDFFGFYAREIADLLSQNESTLSTSNASELSQGKYGMVNGKEAMDCSHQDASSLFENSIGAGFSDFKKGKLKALLRQSVNDLSMEVDEMLDPVVAMSQLRYKLKSNNSLVAASNDNVEDDLRFLLENDNPLLVEQTMKKYSDELSSTLLHMEQKLEETLDTIMSKCSAALFHLTSISVASIYRPMTLIEKQQLQKLIQKLPQENLVRVVDIIQRGRPAGKSRGEEIFVDLEQEVKK